MESKRGKIVEGKALSRHVLRRSRWIFLAVLLMLSFMPRSAYAASAKKITLLIGQTRKLKRENAVWESKNSSVASVSPEGVVTANLRGKTTITATVGGERYRYRITVEEPVLSRKMLNIKLKKTKTLRVKGTSKAFKVTSSDPSIVRVKKKAKNKFQLKGRRDGVTTVKATFRNTVLVCVVTVGNGNAQGNITLSHNGKVLQTLTGKKSKIGKSVSAVSSYGQSAPLYISTGGGDGLENIFGLTNNGNVNVAGVKLSEPERLGTIAKACAWARAVCESQYHGYDDGQKTGELYTWGFPKAKSPGTGDYCCFSLAECAYYFAGVNTLGECLGNTAMAVYPPFSDMWYRSGGVSFWGDTKPRSTSPFDSGHYYPKLGFVEVTKEKEAAGAYKFVYQAGDIVTSKNHQHEQLIIKTGTAKTLEAAEACGPGGGGTKGGDQSGNELKVYKSLFDAGSISHVYRFTGTGVVLNTAGLAG